MSEWAIHTTSLTKAYEPRRGLVGRLSRHKPITAVSDINLAIPKGELFGLLGPNGAGKTTLVKMLATLILPSSGSATIGGHPLSQGGAIRQKVGLVVADERSFFWRLSARRNLTFFAALHGLHAAAAQQRVNAVLADVDLLDVAERRFSDFSSGMRQRLAIARALLHQPTILFLDEPSRSLDPTATAALHALIQRLRQARQMTIFLITHDLAEAEALCDRLAIMRAGQIQAVGSPADLLQQLQPMQQVTIVTNPLETAVFTTLHQQHPTLTQTSHTHQTQLQLALREGDGQLTAVLAILHQHSLPIHAIHTQTPTLEQIFQQYTQ